MNKQNMVNKYNRILFSILNGKSVLYNNMVKPKDLMPSEVSQANTTPSHSLVYEI